MRDDAVARCGGLPRRGLMAAGVGAAWAFLVVRAGMLMVMVEIDILVYEAICSKSQLSK
jgi:hypothetical protein